MVFGNIVPYESASLSKHFLPWKILNATEQLKMTSYLTRACGQWAKEQMLKPSLFKSLKTHIDTENSNGAWLLMASVTGHVPLQGKSFIFISGIMIIEMISPLPVIRYLQFRILTMFKC